MGYCPWPCNISSWSSELLPPPGPFPLASLLLLFAPLSSAANGGLLQFSVTRSPFCIFLFGHLIQIHVCAASTSLLKLRSVFINAISTGIPESTSATSRRKFILLSGSSSWFPYFCEQDCHALSLGTRDLSYPGLIILPCFPSPHVS